MSTRLNDSDSDRGLDGGEIGSTALVESLTRAEVDTQIATAKRWPRSIKKFIDEASEMACLNEATAASCIYALPRGGKSIEGPSARLAEIVMSAWTNCRAGARTVSEDNDFVTSQGAFFDLERNVAITFEVRRRITDSKGRRYNADMIGTTSNAACSIALRNAVFKGIPKAFWAPVYEAARKTAIGDAKTIETRRADSIAAFGKMGVTPDRIFAALQVAGIEDIGGEELLTLRATWTAIKEGDTTIEEAFPVAGKPAPEKPKDKTDGEDEKPKGSKAEQMAAKLGNQQAPETPAETVSDSSTSNEEARSETPDEETTEGDGGMAAEDDLRAEAIALYDRANKTVGKKGATRNALQSFGVTAVKEIPAEKLGSFIDTMNSILEG